MLRPDFFISWFTDNYFQISGRGDEKKNKWKSSENDQLIGHFQSFLISPDKKTVKTSKVNQQSY